MDAIGKQERFYTEGSAHTIATGEGRQSAAEAALCLWETETFDIVRVEQ